MNLQCETEEIGLCTPEIKQLSRPSCENSSSFEGDSAD